MDSEHQAQQGESGHQGQDRQPGKEIGRSGDRAPEPSQAATPGQVRSRSKKAGARRADSGKDALHPGPGRDDAQTNPGNRDKPQPDMEEEVEEI